MRKMRIKEKCININKEHLEQLILTISYDKVVMMFGTRNSQGSINPELMSEMGLVFRDKIEGFFNKDVKSEMKRNWNNYWITNYGISNDKWREDKMWVDFNYNRFSKEFESSSLSSTRMIRRQRSIGIIMSKLRTKELV